MITHHIEDGTWPPDTQIPSERELCEQHGISRTTVRQAVNQAVNAGLLTRIHGKGTFVAAPKIQPLFQITGFAETLAAMGLSPGTRLLELRRQPADAAVARTLDVAPGDEVLRVQVLGLGSGEPMAVYASLVPGRLGALLGAEAERRQALGRPALLGLPRRAPVFRITSVFRSPAGQPVEYRVAVYRGDKYQFHLMRQMYFTAKGG